MLSLQRRKASRRLQRLVCKKNEFDDLPYDVVVNILSRLPITTLIRIKYTCKLWRSIMTDDPLFPELQFSLGVKNPGHVYGIRGNLCFVEKPKDTTVGIKLHDVWPTNKNQKYYLQNDCYLSTCRSLMCYLTMRDKFIHICNPITQDHIKVPIPVDGGISREDISGFGYAPQSKKYKYVRFLRRKLNNSLTAIVFTLGGESWRELEHVPYPPRLGPVYCNGVLYWSAGLKAGPYFVLSFDLETEEFQKRRVFPTGTTYDRIAGVKYLVVLGENVSLVRDLPPDYLEVWTLMDEKNNIWVKKYHLRRTPKLSRTGFKLSGLWMNGDLYGMRTIKKKDGTIVKRLYSYNAESEKYTAIKLPFRKNRNAESILPSLVLNHVGSLISPSKIVTAERKEPSLSTGSLSRGYFFTSFPYGKRK